MQYESARLGMVPENVFLYAVHLEGLRYQTISKSLLECHVITLGTSLSLVQPWVAVGGGNT